MRKRLAVTIQFKIREGKRTFHLNDFMLKFGEGDNYFSISLLFYCTYLLSHDLTRKQAAVHTQMFSCDTVIKPHAGLVLTNPFIHPSKGLSMAQQQHVPHHL